MYSTVGFVPPIAMALPLVSGEPSGGIALDTSKLTGLAASTKLSAATQVQAQEPVTVSLDGIVYVPDAANPTVVGSPGAAELAIVGSPAAATARMVYQPVTGDSGILRDADTGVTVAVTQSVAEILTENPDLLPVLVQASRTLVQAATQSANPETRVAANNATVLQELETGEYRVQPDSFPSQNYQTSSGSTLVQKVTAPVTRTADKVQAYVRRIPPYVWWLAVLAGFIVLFMWLKKHVIIQISGKRWLFTAGSAPARQLSPTDININLGGGVPTNPYANAAPAQTIGASMSPSAQAAVNGAVNAAAAPASTFWSSLTNMPTQA